MTDRPILRLSEPTPSIRLKGTPDKRRRPQGIGRQGQAPRFGEEFKRLEEAFQGESPEVLLRQDPGGIAPERALVFETILPIQDFQKAAAKIGFELLIEDRLDDDYEIPDELVDEYIGTAAPTLYATMPTLPDLVQMLRLWKAYQNGEEKPRGLAPWWKLFDMLSDLRIWGPKDRLTPQAQAELIYRLSDDDDDPITLELEIWPTANRKQRERWQKETRQKVEALGGRVVATSSINQDGFIYEALLIELASGSVREMMENPSSPDTLIALEGLQFVLPQTIAQCLPDLSEEGKATTPDEYIQFNPNAPIRAVLLDGTPIAGHPALDGGVVIEDIHDLVRMSQVGNRRHATSMASLLLRGDLVADKIPVPNSRLLSIPVLVDDEAGATSPNDRLFVDIIHTSLARAFLGEDALAPDAFLVNFSIGVKGNYFTGKIGSLARLLDWWADHHGILFVVSSGNVGDALIVPNKTSTQFEDCTLKERRLYVQEALRNSRHTRTLLAPAEAMNALTVGAISSDFSDAADYQPVGIISIEDSTHCFPAISSAVGLGAFRSIKPDLMHTGGHHEIRMLPSGQHLRLSVVEKTQRSGLNAATIHRGAPVTYKTRGTSCANALTSRAHLFAVAALLDEDGPYDGQEITRRDLALITKALSVNSARWPETAIELYEAELERLNGKHSQAKEEVCRNFGYGQLNDRLMLASPENGATLIGASTLRKDRAVIFDIPLPQSLAGETIERSMWVTIAWFSPVMQTRARYRLALLEAVPHDHDQLGDLIKDDGWCIDMVAHQIDANIIKRGTVWSRRLVQKGATVPHYGEGKVLPIRVQCRDGSGGGLSPDEDIRFAIAVTLEVEGNVQFDIHQEIQSQLRIKLRGGQ